MNIPITFTKFWNFFLPAPNPLPPCPLPPPCPVKKPKLKNGLGEGGTKKPKNCKQGQLGSQ